MSIEQLALETKIPRPSLEALEEDRFSALPGPVFVRGFFRCCARALHLDPETVAGLLHQHLRAQTAGAQRQVRRDRPAAIQAVASPRKPERPAPASKRIEAATTRPTALATGPVSAVAAAPAEQTSGAAMQALHQVFARAQELLHGLSRVPQSRTIMWIAVCLVVAVIAVTAFMLAGGQVTTPHS